MSIDFSTTTVLYLLGGAMVLFGGISYLPSLVRIIQQRLGDVSHPRQPSLGPGASEDVLVRDSDAPPPAGFTAHVDVICQAASNAPSPVIIEYLESGLTEAQVLRHEVLRMSEISSQ